MTTVHHPLNLLDEVICRCVESTSYLPQYVSATPAFRDVLLAYCGPALVPMGFHPDECMLIVYRTVPVMFNLHRDGVQLAAIFLNPALTNP